MSGLVPVHAPTAQDVARVAGVSPATVSFVLNGRRGGDDRVSDETRQRVLDAVSLLGYVPNEAARSLRMRRTKRIGLVLPRFNSPHYEQMAQDIEAVADRYGYTMIVAVTGSAEREKRVLDQMQRRMVDGVIIEPRFAEGAEIAPLVKSGLAVIVDSDYITGTGFDLVRPMRAEVTLQAMRYLLDKGHRRIAFLGNFPQHPVHYGRYESYLQALQERGIAVDNRLVCNGSASMEEASSAVKVLLQLESRPTAIFSASDIGAISVIWAAQSMGLVVPRDLAVIGVGNSPESKVCHPPLTTIGPVHEDFTDIAEFLFDRLEGRAANEGRVLVRPWELLVRGST